MMGRISGDGNAINEDRQWLALADIGGQPQ